jgi:hypothetical protein
LIEIQKGLFIMWKDINWCAITVVFLTIVGLVVGLAAGMAISIHYFEKSVVIGDAMTPKSQLSRSSFPFSQDSKVYLANSHSPRATLFDPMILASNTLIQKKESNKKHYFDLGTVVTASESGHLDVLMVVEESPILRTANPHHIGDFASEDERYDYNNMNRLSGTKHMTSEEANNLVPHYRDWLESQPDIHTRENYIQPTTCKDGSLGFDDWNMLKAAVQEANSISAEQFMKWSYYFTNVGKQFATFEDDLLYYEEDVIFRICPGITLKARRGPIFLNAENVIIECDDCTIDVGGTHLAFGPHANNVLVKGITFRGAHSSSLSFFHDGADASFEDCFWIGNTGSSDQLGAVADINSTSIVNFYRCEIGNGKSRGFRSVSHASSLSIRV